MFKDNLARILSEKKKTEKISQAQIARLAGVSPSGFTEWVKGRSSPNPEKIKKLAEVLNVSVEELIGESIPEDTADTFYIPILGTVPAGNPVEAVEFHEGNLPLSKEYRNSVDFGLRVKGNSMIGASILDGDIVFVKQSKDAQNKQIVVAKIDGEATVKRFYRNGESIILKPENNDFEPILVNKDSDFRLVGVVTGLLRKDIG